MKGRKTLKKPGIENLKNCELLIVPTEKLINWYKHEKGV